MKKMMRRTGLTALIVSVAVAWLQTQAQAALTATLNIDVTIVANLSVSVNGVATSSDTSSSWNTGTPNAKLIGTTVTVTNDSGGQTEKWALSTLASSIDQGVNGSWALAASTTSVGVDQFAVQAVFGSSQTTAGGCPGAAAGNWDNNLAAPLTTSPVTYTSTVFADPTLNNNGTPNPDVTAGGANGRMFASDKRALCWRVITPLSTSSLDTQNIQVIVTAQNP